MTRSRNSRNEPFPVTDDLFDAPDGAVVDGFERSGKWWRPIEEEKAARQAPKEQP